MAVIQPFYLQSNSNGYLAGKVTLSQGSGISLSQSGKTITIAATGSASSSNLQNSSGVANHPYAAYFGPCLTNLIPNPKFHANVTDGITAVGAFTTLSRLTSDPFVGVGHARIQVTASGSLNDGMYANGITCSANTGYVFIAWIKSNTGTNQNLRLRIVPNVSGATNSQTTASGLQLIAYASVDYVPYILNVVTGGSDSSLGVAITTSSAAESMDILVGAWMLARADITATTEASYGHAYFDGDFAGCSWSGTSNNSSSTRAAPFAVERAQAAAGPINTGIWLDNDTGAFSSNHIHLSFPNDQGFLSISQGGIQYDALGNPAYLGPYYFEINGTLTTQANSGFVGAIMRVENYGDGIVAFFTGANTTQDIIVIDAGALTSGSALAIFAPEDKATFASNNGTYFVFTGKGSSSQRPDYTFGPEMFLFGVAAETLNKQFKQFGGGAYKRTETDSGRTASKAGSTITKVTGTNFDSGSPTFQSGDRVVLGGSTFTILTVSSTTMTTAETGNITTATLYLVDSNYSPFYAQMEGAGPADHRKVQGAYGLNNFYIDSGRNPRIGFPDRTTSARTCSGSSGSGAITLSGADSNASAGNWIVPYGHEQRQIVTASGTSLVVAPVLDSTLAAGTSFELILHSTAAKPDMDSDADPINMTIWIDKTSAGPSASSSETSIFSSQPMFPSGSLLIDLNDRIRTNHGAERLIRISVSGSMTCNDATVTLRLKYRYRTGTWTTLSTNIIGSIPGNYAKSYHFTYDIACSAVSTQTIYFNMSHDEQYVDHLVVDPTAIELTFDSTSKEVVQDGLLNQVTTSAISLRPDIEFDITSQGSGSITFTGQYKSARLL